MLEDKLLVWRFKRGSSDALRQIYAKYKNDLLALAVTLSPDRAAAEDVVHDVFVSFAEFADRLDLRGSLKSYLSSCVANRVRNIGKAKDQQTVQLDQAQAASLDSELHRPDRLAISAEQLQQVAHAMTQLPHQQREAIVLHLQAGLKFKQIAETQGVSINTIQSRYRYGLDKLRSLLNSEIEK